MGQQINPITGLPIVEDINPISGLPNPKPSQTNYVGKFTGVGFRSGDNSEFDAYGIDPLALYDREEERAKRQSRTEKWTRGAGKMGITFAGAVAENTIGVALGLGDYIFSGFDSFSESMANNPIGLAADELNQWAQEELPNYYTQEELAQKGTLAELGSANFWSDKFLNGAAYSLGSIAAAYLTMGMGPVGLAGKATGLSAKMSKALAAYNVAKNSKGIVSVRGATNTLNALSRGKAMATKGLKTLGQFESGFTMSMAEAAVESRETKERVKETLLEEAKKRKAVLTGEENWENVVLDDRELDQIELQAGEAEGAAFYGNMAVLIPSNLVMFKNMVTPFRAGVGFNKVAKDAAGKSYVEAVSKLPKGIKQAAIVGRTVTPFLKTGATEALQEGMQYAISQGVSDYELRKFKSSGAGELVESLMETGRLKATLDASGDVLDRAKASFEDPEARSQMLVGAMVGLLTGGFGGVQEIRQKNKNTKTVLEVLNDPAFYKLGKRAEDVNAGVETIRKMMKAQEEGDQVTYERLQSELITQQVLHHLEMGSYDMFEQRMKDAKEMSDEEFKKEFGIEEDVEFTKEFGKTQIVDRILKQAEIIKTGKERVEAIFPPDKVMGAGRLFMSKEDKLEEEERLKDEQIYKNFLIHNYATLKTLDGEIQTSIEKLQKLVPNTIALKSDLSKYKRTGLLANTPKLEELRMEFEEYSKDIVGLDKLAYDQEVDKLMGLIMSKNNSEIAFDNLVRSPEQRDLFVTRTKAKAEQARIKAIQDKNEELVKDTLAKATKSSELEQFLNDPEAATNYSEQSMMDIAAKYRELTEIENTTKERSYYFSLEELEKAFAEEEDPIKKAILKDIITYRRDNNLTDPIKQAEEGTPIESLFGEAAPTAETAEEDVESQLKNKEGTPEPTAADFDIDPNEDVPILKVISFLKENRNIALSKNGEFYIMKDADGKVIRRFKRVSDLKNAALGYKSTTSTPAQKAAMARGTIVDEMFRQAIIRFNTSKQILSVQELKAIYEASPEKKGTYEFTDGFIKDIRVALTEIITSASNNGYVLETNFPPIFGTINGQDVAGTVDFIAYNKKGDIIIVDLKTSSKLRRELYKNPKDKTELGDALQLESYKELISQMVGLPLQQRPGAYILPLFTPVTYKVVKGQKKRSGSYTRATAERAKVNNKFGFVLPNTQFAKAKALLNIQSTSLRSEAEELEGVLEKAQRQEEGVFSDLVTDAITPEEFNELLKLARIHVNAPKLPRLPNDIGTRYPVLYAKLVAIEIERKRAGATASSKLFDDRIKELNEKHVGQIVNTLFESPKGTSRVETLSRQLTGKDVIIANGELQNVVINNKYKVQVDGLGNLQRGNDSNQVQPNGVPYVIDRNFLKTKTSEQLAQLEFKFKLIPTKWAIENASKVDKRNVPIGVYAINKEGGETTEVLVGMIAAANANSTTDYTNSRIALVTKLESGAEMGGKLKTFHAGNIINTYKTDANGNQVPAFFPVNEAKGDAEIMFTSKGIDESMIISKELIDDLTDEQLVAIKALNTSYVSGRVLALVRRPGEMRSDELGHIGMYTANIDDAAVEAIKQIILRTTNKSNVGNDIKEIVGLPISIRSGFYVTTHEVMKNAEAIIYFPHVEFPDKMIRISNTELAKALNGKAYVFQIGKIENATKDTQITNNEGVEEVVTAEILDLYTNKPKLTWTNIVPGILKEAIGNAPAEEYEIQKAIMMEEINRGLNKGKARMLESFETSLKALRRNVDIEKANQNLPYTSKVTGISYNSYLDYLSSPQELSAPQQDKTSILSMDSKAHNGSFFYDLQMEFSIFETIGNQPVAEETVPPAPPSNPNQSTMNQSPDSKVNIDPGYIPKSRQRRPTQPSENKGEDIKNKCQNQ